jgi:hypothetical protein
LENVLCEEVEKGTERPTHLRRALSYVCKARSRLSMAREMNEARNDKSASSSRQAMKRKA